MLPDNKKPLLPLRDIVIFPSIVVPLIVLLNMFLTKLYKFQKYQELRVVKL